VSCYTLHCHAKGGPVVTVSRILIFFLILGRVSRGVIYKAYVSANDDDMGEQ
jgi:hypothetical protein